MNNEKIALRPEVQWFAEQMELKLRENDHKGGWKDCDVVYLHDRLQEEVKELGLASPFDHIQEAVDVANFAMMIADNARSTIEPTEQPEPPKGLKGDKQSGDQ